MPRDAVRGKPIPGTSSDTAEEVMPAADIFEGEIGQAIENIRARCLQCHVESDVTSSAIEAGAKSDEPLMIPSRWLRRGLFDHAAHPGLHCAVCHAGAYAELPKELRPQSAEAAAAVRGGEAALDVQSDPEDHRQVMIRGIESCTPCHRDVDAALLPEIDEIAAGGLLGTTSSWAPASCATCHRYHWSRPRSSHPAEPKAGVVVAP